jgi:hypothetical protein
LLERAAAEALTSSARGDDGRDLQRPDYTGRSTAT